jgi:large subunit ribosomal protein L9
MKVILADDIRGLGHRGDTVTVKPGFARNYLFPNGFAYEATAANLQRLTEERKKYDVRTNQERAVAEEIARRMDGLTVVIPKKAGEGDVLYGSVTPSEIADALAERGIEVDRRRIEVAEPIKRLGEHTVHVRLHREVVALLKVDVQPAAPATA